MQGKCRCFLYITKEIESIVKYLREDGCGQCYTELTDEKSRILIRTKMSRDSEHWVWGRFEVPEVCIAWLVREWNKNSKEDQAFLLLLDLPLSPNPIVS
jgi:hypothetical protein